MAKKACRNCKLIVTGSECPLCKGNKFATNLKNIAEMNSLHTLIFTVFLNIILINL